MPNERKKHKKWPAYVHEANGRIVYRPRVNGKFIRPIRIGPIGMSDADVWNRYNEIINSMKPEGTLGWLSECFFQSEQFKERSDRTQSDYHFHSRVLKHPINNGEITLSDVNLSDLNTRFFRKLLDKRANRYLSNGKSVVPANREIALLSVIFSWGLQYKDIELTSNPCKGIKKKKENVRKKYIEGAHNMTGHYKAVYDLAAEREQIIMEICYLTACRGQEVINLKLSDRLDEGLLLKRLKGSKANTVEYSDRLASAIKRAVRLHKILGNTYLIPGANSDQLNRSTLKTAMQRLRERCQEKGIEPLALHDLKRTGHTDAEDEKLTGHKSESMRNRYRVKPENVKPAR